MKKEEITTLVQKIRNKDNNAIGELYELVYRDIYFTAYKVLKNKEDAEDIVHDSFIICMKKIDTLKDDTAFLTFINRTVMNKSLNYLRDSKFELSDVTVNADGEEVVMDIEDTSKHANVEKVINDAETQRMVMEIIDKLPELQRMTIMLFYYEDFNISDIAKIMECSDNTVKSRLNYARKTIKAEVEKLRKKYGDDILVVVPFLGKLIKAAASTEVPQDLSVATNRMLEECTAINLAAKEGKMMMLKNKIMEQLAKNTPRSLALKGLGIAAGISVLTGVSLAIAGNGDKKVTVSADTTSTQAVASNKSVQAVKPAEVPSEPTTEVDAVESTEEATEVTEDTVEAVEPTEEVVEATENAVESKDEEPVVEATEKVVAVESKEEVYSEEPVHEHDWSPVYTTVHHDATTEDVYKDITYGPGQNSYYKVIDPEGTVYYFTDHIQFPEDLDYDCVGSIDTWEDFIATTKYPDPKQYKKSNVVRGYNNPHTVSVFEGTKETPAYDEEVVDHYECSCGATQY